MEYTITAYSTALFSTWINVEELGLLIDAGDGVSAGLLQKSRKVKNVFITHPDRDHLTGLFQFIQLNSRENLPVIHYPKDCGSFPAIKKFLEDFDLHVAGSQWFGIENGQRIKIKAGFEIEAMRNEHIPAPTGVHKSLSYKLYKVKQKLKREFSGLSPEYIKSIVLKKGKEFVTEHVERNVISFSGDTPIDDYAKWDKSEILMHECTFLRNVADENIEVRGKRHTNVTEVLQMAKEISIDKLILCHFSTRYSNEEIDQAVLNVIKDLQIQIPVYLVYPGEIKKDILTSKAVNE